MEAFQELYNFVDRAVKGRKYPESTAIGLRSALKLYEVELNEEERESLDKFKANFEQISASVIQKNRKKYSDSSLLTYKSRVVKVLNEYQKYGTSPQKMVAWAPSRRTRTKKHAAVAEATTPAQVGSDIDPGAIEAGAQRIELPLRAGAKVVVLLPSEVTGGDIKKIKTLLDLVEVKE